MFYGWKVFAVRQDLACWLPKGAGSTAVSQPCVLRTVSLPRQPELGFLSTGSKAEVPGHLYVQIPTQFLSTQT